MDQVFYKPTGNEVQIFDAAFKKKCPVLLSGPTGCGKTRFVEFMASRLDRPMVQISCNEDTSASDLLGRYLILGNETVWQDGPVTKAVRTGAILYVDEVAEARQDVIVLLHPLTDHRRILTIDRRNEEILAHPDFMVVASFNPGYQSGLHSLKPSTRQRFVTMCFGYPDEATEADIITNETALDPAISKKLVQVATKIRNAKNFSVPETVSTRLLVNAGHLIAGGLTPRQAAIASIAGTLTDEAEVRTAITDLITLIL